MVDSKLKKGEWKLRSRLKTLVADREAAIGRRITQTEISEATGLNPMTVSRWMGPKPIISMEADVVEQLCKFLNCGICELLYFDREPAGLQTSLHSS